MAGAGGAFGLRAGCRRVPARRGPLRVGSGPVTPAVAARSGSLVPTVAKVAVRGGVRPANCVTVAVAFPTMMAPLRVVAPVCSSTSYRTIPSPVPVASSVSRRNATVLLAVHEQVEPVVPTANSNGPPPDGST